MLATATQIAKTAGISERAVRMALGKGEWRGLKVNAFKINCSWMASVESLPLDIQTKLHETNELVLEPFNALLKSGISEAAIDVARWRNNVILPALTAPRGSAERKQAVREIVSTTHYRDNKPVSVSEPTAYRWISSFEADGLAGLIPSARADRGTRRVLVTRKWDKGIDLGNPEKANCAETLETYGKSLKARAASLREICRLGSHKLYELSQDAGSVLPKDQLRLICGLNIKWAKQFDAFGRVARRDLDNKAYFDRDEPRMRRKPAERPMQMVFGDVHPLDIYLPSGDGKSQLKVRLIVWMCDATHHLWVHPAILGKGQGIRQIDVADGLHAMVADPHGGLPEALYLDNGSEYGALAKAMAEFPDFYGAFNKRCVVKARP